MKKKVLSIFAFAALLCLSKTSNAQWTQVGTEVTSSSSDLVGIGTTVGLSDKLTINGTLSFQAQNTQGTSNYRSIRGRAPYHGLAIYGDNNYASGGGITINSYSNSADPGTVSVVAGDGGTGLDKAFQILTYDNGAYTQRLMLNKMGNVGIGTSTLAANNILTVGGNTTINGAATIWGSTSIDGDIQFEPQSNNYRSIWGKSSNHGLSIYGNNGFADGAGITINSTNHNTDPGAVSVVARDGGSTASNAFQVLTFDGSANPNAYTQRMVITKDGQVKIGDVPLKNANDYKLYVENGILTEKVKVALSSDPQNWSDFVFEEDYELRSLNEVEDYIKENKHLPEIPSTDEVHKNGLDLAQMDAKLLQKVEELTLYIIDQQKRIEQLEKKLNK